VLGGFFSGLDWLLDKITPDFDFGKKEEQVPSTKYQRESQQGYLPPGVGIGAGGPDIFKSLISLKSLDALLYYFTSGQFDVDAMKGAATPEESFESMINILKNLEIFSPYEEGEGIFSFILDPIREFFESLGLGGTAEDGTQPTSYLGDSVSDLVTATQQLNETGVMTLNLEINSDTQLTLDSQVIGTAVKQFVYEEMLKREGASSSATTKTFTM
jgi:hypothetical protein